MPGLEDNRRTWTVYDWKGDGGEEWSSAWGGSQMLWRVTLFPRLAPFLPAGNILEIAPGGGRVTAFLLQACERLDVVDIARSALDACRERFARHDHIHYHLGSGNALDFLPDASIDLAVSWDSLVHAESDIVDGYVLSLSNKLRPGGVAVLHHSNLAAHRLADGSSFAADMDRPENGWRAGSVRAESVRHACERAGLVCTGQEIFAWSRPPVTSDCLTVFARPLPGRSIEPGPVTTADMPAEMQAARRIASVYRPPT